MINVQLNFPQGRLTFLFYLRILTTVSVSEAKDFFLKMWNNSCKRKKRGGGRTIVFCEKRSPLKYLIYLWRSGSQKLGTTDRGIP